MGKLSEFNIIETFSLHSKPIDYGGIGIGDDCAVLPSEGGVCKVVTTDTLTEDTHFILSLVTPENLAYKSLASNISDVISMGATPKYAFLAITFTEDIDKEWIESFALSFSKLANSCGVLLLGGDTTFSKHALTITITVIGEVKQELVKLRSGANIGDKIFVVSPLGGSALGLNHLLNNELGHPSVDLHYRPKLFIKEACWLATRGEIGAMMDISDGIAKDLTHILEQSRVGAAIFLDKIPIYNGASMEMALGGGEEYSLLFTARKEDVDRLKSDYFSHFDREIFEIGEINSNLGEISWYDGENKLDSNFKGYEHGAK